MLVRFFGFSGKFAANGWAARQVCKKWMVVRANLQVMGGLALFLSVNPSITCKGGADKKLDTERKEICIQRKKSGKRWKSTRGKEA